MIYVEGNKTLLIANGFKGLYQMKVSEVSE